MEAFDHKLLAIHVSAAEVAFEDEVDWDADEPADQSGFRDPKKG